MSQTSTYRSYAENNPYTIDQIDAKRAEARGKSVKSLLMLGGSVLALAGGIVGYEHLTAPSGTTVTEIAQPGDNPTTLANKAEEQYGNSPGDFDIQREAMRIHNQYGTIQPGEKVQVHVK